MYERFNALIADLKDETQKTAISNFVKYDITDYLEEIDQLSSEILESTVGLEDDKSLNLKRINDEIIKSGENLLGKVENKPFTKKFREEFRKLRPDLFYSSEIMEKGFKKLRGYPGDFEMMNYVYENQICSKSKMGQYWDKYFIQNAYAEAVRGRKNKMVHILKKYISSFKGKEVHILNLPCGPARDVKELLDHGSLRSDLKVNITCIDQDLAALDFAKNSIKNIPSNITLFFKQGNILDYVRHPLEQGKKLGQFDLVYSIGLADYLPDKLLQNMINFSWSLLNEGGNVIYAFKIEDKDPFAPLPPKWFCDWEFIPRDEEDAQTILNNSKLGDFDLLPLEWEETGRIAFYNMKRK